MAEYDEREDRPRGAPIIEDKRHIRDVDEEAELAEEEAPPEPAAAPEVSDPVSEVVAGPTPVPTPIEELAKERPTGPTVAEGGTAAGAPTEQELAELQQAEYAYLMQLFQLGLHGYLRSQLGILLNFALISLGRAPNPSTGLVTADLEQAKLAIDAMEFIMVRVQASMQTQERSEMAQWLSDLKYTFMQSLGGAGAKVAAPGDGEA